MECFVDPNAPEPEIVEVEKHLRKRKKNVSSARSCFLRLLVIQSKWPCANEVSEISPVRYVGDHFPFHIEGWWLFFYPPSYLTLTSDDREWLLIQVSEITELSENLSKKTIAQISAANMHS